MSFTLASLGVGLQTLISEWFDVFVHARKNETHHHRRCPPAFSNRIDFGFLVTTGFRCAGRRGNGLWAVRVLSSGWEERHKGGRCRRIFGSGGAVHHLLFRNSESDAGSIG